MTAMRIFVILCITAVISAEHSKIHEKMTDEERASVFGTNFHEDMEYEVTPIAHAEHPSRPRHRIIELTSFSRKMKFYLEPTDGILAGTDTPVFKARRKDGLINNVQFQRLPNAIQGKYKMYHDIINNGAFLLHHDHHGHPLIKGIIDLPLTMEKLIIQPLLERFRKHFAARGKRQAPSDFEYTHQHVVYKVPGNNTRRLFDRFHDGQRHIEMIALAHRRRARYLGYNRVPDVIYPQAMIVVEATYFKLFNRDVNRIIEYLLAYWNGVDLRYRAYRQPEIRLNVAAIILAEDPSVTPYIDGNVIHVRGLRDNKVNVTRALRQNAEFLYPEVEYNDTDKTLKMRRLNFKFDFAITMTTMDICQLPVNCADPKTRQYTCAAGNVLTRYCGTLGLAFYTGSCAYDPDYKEVEAVGIVEDDGGFSGIIPTAHEIGHLLGASHDRNNEHKCDWDDGYLMSYSMIVTSKSFVWSNCSVESVKKFLQRESRARCMFDKPYSGRKIPRVLPGRLYSRDKVCRNAAGTGDCPDRWFNQQCDKLYCASKNPSSRSPCEAVRNHAVPEGAPCGNGFMCLNAVCVKRTNAYVHLQLATTSTTTTTTELTSNTSVWMTEYYADEED